MLRKLLAIVVLAGVFSSSFGQDIHFSQYYASPLTLNPAMTGGFNGVFRAAANFRSQWFSIGDPTPYQTYSASFDAPVFRDRLNNDLFGLGTVFFSDRSGDGALTTTSIMASLGYTKSVDQYDRHSLAVGIQAGLVQKRIDFTKLTFAEQFDGDFGFDPLAYNGEANIDDNIMYADVNVGVLWRSAVGKKLNTYIGFAYHHLTKPNESFLDNEDNELDPRFTVHGGVDIKMSKYVTLTPGFLFLAQNTAREINGGAALGFELTEDSKLFVGAWYRALDRDAFIGMVAYQIVGLRIGLSYDVNTSDLNVASNSNGGVELSAIYIFKEEKPRSSTPAQFCPTF